jgi:5-hydroxyisourate hydrolase
MTPSLVSTHVLDNATGAPAEGVAVVLQTRSGDHLAAAVTDADGRAVDLGPAALAPGAYRLVFDTGAWFAAQDRDTFYPEVVLTFAVREPAEHHHVPLLLAPFAYSTYRGS